MQVEWFGQSAFALAAPEIKVFVDPFDDLSPLLARGMRFDYPPIDATGVDLVLVTHEHIDHNGVEAIAGEPAVLRSTAGRLDSPIGEVVAIASEHDRQAGTERGPNTIFTFELDGIRIVHFGDFGQSELRPEQVAAIGKADLIFLPVGGGPTIDASAAVTIVKQLGPRWVVPMHYRTIRTSFLESAEEFLELMPYVQRLATPSFQTADLSTMNSAVVVVPATP